uniref:Uncharacterized protein n=1 Tax=Nelumbo nucifera TaxID=4432 RepID=A0A822Z701_NELNU|nr:TPA_asm: hypothetical protein HUJ06_013764 [Nelumbo nucifera]
MYSKCRDIVGSHRVFDEMPDRNLVTCNAMIRGIGQLKTARQLFEEMPQRNCYSWYNVKEAREIFDRIPVKNLVNWNSLIAGYAQN